jgi:HAE1 family hydrophobic/amphiphilic exporter-1
MKEIKNIDELNIKLNVIGKITQFFTNRFEMALLLIALVTAIGILSYNLLPKESLPEIVFPSITVQTLYLGASPEDVEALVTQPIESRLSGLEDVTDLFSTSNEGLSVVQITFEEGVDMDRKKLELDNEISSISLPETASAPESFVFKTSEFPLISLSLTGPELFQLTDVSEEVKIELEKLNGVDTVTIFGGLEKEIQVVTNQVQLSKYGVTLNTISNALQANNVKVPLGDVKSGNLKYNLRIDESFQNIEAIRNTPITTADGSTIFIKDLAAVIDGTKTITEFNRSYIAGGDINNSVFLEVTRENQSDVIGTSDRIKNRLQEIQGSVIPVGIGVVISRDSAIQVRDDLDSITSNALSGLIVVVLVLFLFIGFREALIVAITIPLTLLATLGTLSFFGITLNTFAILGLIVALGLLVDNTIIVMENMDRLRKKGASVEDAAIYGSNQVGFPITAATMTTVAAFFPLAILPGIIGAFINTIPRTIIMTLILSLILAITITPSVYTFVNKRFGDQKKPQTLFGKIGLGAVKLSLIGGLSVAAFYDDTVWIGIPIIATLFFVTMTALKDYGLGDGSMENNKLIVKYEAFITRLVKSKVRMGLTLTLAAVIFISSFFLIIGGQLKIAFFPQTEPASMTINVDMPSGQSLEQSSEIVALVEAILIESDNVKQFNSTIGGRSQNTGVINLDFAENDVNGFDKLAIIQESLESVPGANISVIANAQGGPPVGKPIEIKFIGDDLEASKEAMELYVTKLKNTEGVFNIEQSINEGGREQFLNIDVIKANTYGMTPIYIASQVRSLTDGITATSIKDGEDLVDVRLTLDQIEFDDILSLYITTPFGEQIPLSAVMTIEEQIGVSGITRENQNRTITVTADLLNGYNASEVVSLIEESILASEIDASVTVSFGGETAGIADSFGDLFRSMILAIFLVFMILTIQFGSVKQPFIIITTVPMAMIGVLYGLTITGNEFGFYAFMALVSLVGIAVNDAIVLIDYMNYLRKEGTPFYEAIAKAGRTRFNPVLATTLTTIGGILPLSFKNAYYAQFGYALIFGLLVTTVLTLVVIPIGYSLLEGRSIRKENKSINYREVQQHS